MDTRLDLPPTHDVIFSYIFRDISSSEAMLSLVNAIRIDKKKEPFESIVELKSQYSQMGKSADHKYGTLDVRVKAKDGSLINIEMQVNPEPGMDQRMTYYAANMISELKVGEEYHSLPKTDMIIIEGHGHKPNPDGRYHHSYSMRDDEPPHDPIAAWVGLHKLSLPTFADIEFDPENKLHWWMAYLGGRYSDEKFVEEACKVDMGIMQFAERYNLSLNDPEVMDSYRFYKTGQLNYNSGMGEARREGRQEGRYGMLTSAYKAGISERKMRTIAKEDGMSAEEFDAMFKEIRKTVKPPRSM